MFSPDSKSAQYWKTLLKEHVRKRFHNALTEAEAKPDYDLRYEVSILGLFHRIQDVVGAKINVEFLDKFVMSDNGLYVLSSAITPKQIELYPIVKGSHRYYCIICRLFISRVSFEEATVISHQAVQETNENFSAKLFKEAENRYKQTLRNKPDDYRGIFCL